MQDVCERTKYMQSFFRPGFEIEKIHWALHPLPITLLFDALIPGRRETPADYTVAYSCQPNTYGIGNDFSS